MACQIVRSDESQAENLKAGGQVVKRTMIDHITSSSWFTAAWVFLISAWGGIAGYIKKISEGKARDFSIKELLGEIVISSFVGVITYFLCVSAGIDETLTAAIVGMSGHMGSRAIYFI